MREWFGQRLEQANPEAWRAAHSRLYEYLHDTTQEGETPTLEDLAPLYQAISHGCRAGLHQDALRDIYKNRICRRVDLVDVEFYAAKKLGAVGSDLAAISWFFEKPYETPTAAVTAGDRVWVLGVAASNLCAQGRLAEALPAQRAALRMGNDTADWGNAATRLDWANTAISLNNLSEAELLSGEVTAAAASAERSVAYADRSGSEFEIVRMRATYADVLHAAGQHEKAERLFADAEDRQKKWQPMYPLLYSVGGYQYCDLLVARREWAAATGRASQTPEYVRRENWLLDIALDALTLGRAHLGMALDGASQRLADPARNDARAAGTMLGEAVDGLRSASHLQFVPRGLLARAAFRCSVGDWNSAARDLDEVEEVAEPGPMRLFLCDMALERARLAFARMEAFAPLNGLTDDSPSKPKPPTEAERQSLHTEAAKQLAIAAEYITTCGYHRRDEELAELEAVLAGQRRFADLPPRV